MPLVADIYYFTNRGGKTEKPPLVLIHGAGGSHLYWPPEIRRLTGLRVLALDLPGHGKSGGRGQQSIAGYVQSVIDWLQAMEIYKANFTGHSMGAAICLDLALNYPDQVNALCLIGSGAKLRVHPEIIQNLASETTFHRAITHIIAHGFSPTTPQRLKELAEKRMLQTRQSVLYSDFTACDAFDVTGRISHVVQPTMIIHGNDDRLVPKRYAQFLADQIPNARLEIVPDAGHMVMLEKPLLVSDIMKIFFANLD
jgi:pimeloyl-ACP methyl ester carboxylesterase